MNSLFRAATHRVLVSKPSANKQYFRRFSSGSKSILLVAEHDNSKIISNTWNTLTAAKQLNGEINVLLAGSFTGENGQKLAKQIAKMEGVTRVLLANKDTYKHSLAENIAQLIKNCQDHYKFGYIVAPSSSFGKNVLPRVAGILGISSIPDVTQVKGPDTFVRPIYAGNALATVKSTEDLKIITVRTTAFDKAKEKSSESEIVPLPDNLNLSSPFSGTQWIADELKVSTRPDLQTARIVISGGRGMKSAENFKILEALADQLNGAVGASRAAVDSGFASNDMQIGQTGKIIAPELYIGVGVSGAIQHLAGMKDSKVIAIINKDAEAPFFQVADYGIVGDLFKEVPEMTEYIKKVKAQA